MKRTLEVEEILALSALADRHEALVHTAKAGAYLASMVRGAIRGCDDSNDPGGRVKAMLTTFLEIAGFEP